MLQLLNSFVFSLLLFNSSCSNNAKIDIREGVEINYRIGYKNSTPYFYGVESNSGIINKAIYYFKDDILYLYRKAPDKYVPVFVNENCEIFVYGSKVLIEKKNTIKEISLPHSPIWLVATTNADTIYYTSTETSVGENDISLLNYFVVNTGIALSTQHLVDFEGLWFTQSGFFFSFTEYLINADIGEIERTKTYLYKNDDVITNKKSIVADLNGYRIYDIDKEGLFFIKRKRNDDFILQSVQCSKGISIKNPSKKLLFFDENSIKVLSIKNSSKSNLIFSNKHTICN